MTKRFLQARSQDLVCVCVCVGGGGGGGEVGCVSAQEPGPNNERFE